MNNEIFEKIQNLCFQNNIDMLDLNKIQITAIKYKLYDIVAYLNSHSTDYLKQAKKQYPKH